MDAGMCVICRRNLLLSGAAAMSALSHPILARAETTEELGRRLDAALLEAFTPLNDGRLHSKLRRILTNLAPYIGLDPESVSLKVLIGPQVNALATGGGRIYIFTGILDFCRSEGEIAGIIGHELTHLKNDDLSTAIFRAKAISIGKTVLINVIRIGLNNAISSKSSRPSTNYGSEILGKVGNDLSGRTVEALGILLSANFSREQEYEADAGGLRAMRGAGYQKQEFMNWLGRLGDTTAAAEVSKKDAVAANQGPKFLGILNAHYMLNDQVTIAERIERLGNT